MRIIPAIDVIEGKCVRLTRGDYKTRKIYSNDPLEVARSFQDSGITSLHLVDLDGAKAGQIINYKVLENIVSGTALSVDFGGGLKSNEDLRIAFECGANQVTGGSIAIKSPEVFETWISKYGSQKIILGADARNGKIAVSGWQETSDTELIPFVKGYSAKGISYVICTDIGRDGMLKGPAIDLYRSMLNVIPSIKLIASGGVSSISEIPVLEEVGCEGVIIGKAIYENKISLKELEQYIVNKN